MLSGYMTVKEAAAKWKVTERAVQIYCKKGQIPGVTRIGRIWMIPEGTNKPTYVLVCTNDKVKADAAEE